MAVVMVYFIYTIYEADYLVREQSDFYQYLGVPLDADEKRIKSRFRRLYEILRLIRRMMFSSSY